MAERLNKDGYTVKEAAFDLAIRALFRAHEGEEEVEEYSTTPKGNPSPAFARELREEIANLHDYLLEQSGMDGIGLG